MKVKVMKAHFGEGKFPTFLRGTSVTIKEECTHFLHWYSCEIEGYQTYVPECFVNNGILIRDYNPTELVQEEGNVVDVQEIIYSWLLAADQGGIIGWIPAESVVTENELK